MAPNPFRGSTTIRWDRAAGTRGRVDLYDARGRLVPRLVAGAAISRELVWDGKNGAGRPVSPGIYFVRAESGRSRSTAKVTRLR